MRRNPSARLTRSLDRSDTAGVVQVELVGASVELRNDSDALSVGCQEIDFESQTGSGVIGFASEPSAPTT